MILEVRRDAKFPFLTLRPVIEGRAPPAETIELSGDEFADYEEAARKFADWQGRISEMDYLPR